MSNPFNPPSFLERHRALLGWLVGWRWRCSFRFRDGW
jgi:hypothetical protein